MLPSRIVPFVVYGRAIMHAIGKAGKERRARLSPAAACNPHSTRVINEEWVGGVPDLDP